MSISTRLLSIIGTGRPLWEKTGIRKSKKTSCVSEHARSSVGAPQRPEKMEAEVRSLLPWPLWCWIGVGIDGRRCWVVVVWHYIGFWRICWGGVLWHAVWLAVGDGVGGRGSGRRGVREVKVERSRGSSRSGRCSRRWDPLQDNMWVKLRLGAVEPGHGGLQQTLLTPERQKHNKPSVITNMRTHMKCIHVRLRLHFKIRLKYRSKQTTGLLKHVRNYRNATTIK